ncbi:cephalosporin-C deacetylase [Terrimicrobium sacchariphilum]|uniref:Cephalosporin-C deacetylase n=1 Tax=Terrimicrobium sacchariphilum TaxID=690879 RepID=A0A146GE92_TERSA|nr:acetylxylan esterase [Terrimicrobium sacchariphilum]GAT35452.1 cephalosporin-C deacetylase [Terrimicrobium sacchariphilum]
MNIASANQILLGVLALSIAATAGWAVELTLSGKTDKEVALYQPGEPMVFQVQLLEDGKPVGDRRLRWTRTGDDGKTEKGETVASATGPLVITTSTDQPGFVRIQVEAVDDAGKPLLGSKQIPIRFDGGAGVQPEKLVQGAPEPADFDTFWKTQVERLKEVPMKFTMTEVSSADPAYVTYDVKIDCAGGKPVSGYLTKPRDAAPKSLRANGVYMGYGVSSAKPYTAPGTMMLCINAHGIENGKEAEYYKGLGLEKYGFKNEENARPETAYFNGMILRVLRSLEFLKAQPEWNGRDLIVSGGSQGGFQALSGAALDKDVTKCMVNVPWMCDLAGVNVGRLRGWRPDYAEGLGYYDSVNMARHIACPVTITAGLGDYVCPPSGVAVLYNNLKSAKQLDLVQGMTHQYSPPKPQQKIALKADLTPSTTQN